METPLKQISPLPRHVAVIMDGNRRWAESRKLPRFEGHRAGVRSLRLLVERIASYHIDYLTVYGFSTENWSRSKNEIDSLLSLVIESLGDNTPEMMRQGIRMRHLGRLDDLPEGSRRAIIKAVERTKNNTGLNFNFAFNYGGRVEILTAVRNLMAKCISPASLNEELFNRYLYTDSMPDVDLVIRTGGESRLSNFLLWQSAYAELYFSDILWPDFGDNEIDEALSFYIQKQRRFGGG